MLITFLGIIHIWKYYFPLHTANMNVQLNLVVFLKLYIILAMGKGRGMVSCFLSWLRPAS